MPVVDAGASGSAPYDRAFINHHHFCPASGGMHGSMASGDAATENKHIGAYLILFPIVCRVWPRPQWSIVEVVHFISLRADLIADEWTRSGPA
jgi:hypothetical protein